MGIFPLQDYAFEHEEIAGLSIHFLFSTLIKNLSRWHCTNVSHADFWLWNAATHLKIQHFRLPGKIALHGSFYV